MHGHCKSVWRQTCQHRKNIMRDKCDSTTTHAAKIATDAPLFLQDSQSDATKFQERYELHHDGSWYFLYKSHKYRNRNWYIGIDISGNPVKHKDGHESRRRHGHARGGRHSHWNGEETGSTDDARSGHWNGELFTVNLHPNPVVYAS